MTELLSVGTYGSNSHRQRWHPAAEIVGLLIECTLPSASWKVARRMLEEVSWDWEIIFKN